MHTNTALKSVAALAISLTALLGGGATANATSEAGSLGRATAPSNAEDTVNLTQLYTVDGHDYPVCAMEDCSDQPAGVGIWEDRDTGNWYLTNPVRSQLIVDDTVR